MTMVTYENYQNITDMAVSHPGSVFQIAATILGPNYPTTATDFEVFHWDYFDTTTPDGVNYVASSSPDPGLGVYTSYGRWIKISTTAIPQVSSDWTASSGAASILNKPSLATVATTGDYTNLTNKPSLATVATTGAYSDLTGKPTLLSQLAVGTVNLRTFSLATAYQASDNTKPAVVTVNLNSVAALTISGGTTVIGEVRIGSANTVATGTSGTAVGSYKNSLTGTLVIGLAINTESQQTITFVLPAGWYFAIRQTTGTGLSVVSAFDQSLSN